MTENWAASELTEEQEEEVRDEIANASEDEPAPDTSQEPKWEGDDRDKRPPSEKYVEAPEGEPEPGKKADPPKDAPKEEKEAEKPAESTPEPNQFVNCIILSTSLFRTRSQFRIL